MSHTLRGARESALSVHRILAVGLDTLMDYVFSFWVLKAVPADHPRVAVWAQPGCIRTIL